ncbi:MAG: hypothetical protein JNM88_08890 [Chitinophagaceae bacterium]|nr:hypothetical protein [Chitinophagaceae bacterium]
MTGTWFGYYQFDDINYHNASGYEKTYFTISINSFDGKHFKGIVNDDVKSGGMEGAGEIVGKISGENICFKKFMPREAILYPNGELQYSDRKHPTLYYTGIISKDKKEISGVWKFKIRIGFIFGFIPVSQRPGKGTWSMSLQ